MSTIERAWKLGLTTSHRSQVLNPKYDMDACNATLSEGEAWDLCGELGQAKTFDPTSNTSPKKFSHKIIKF
jgi:hypothetical protein